MYLQHHSPHLPDFLLNNAQFVLHEDYSTYTYSIHTILFVPSTSVCEYLLLLQQVTPHNKLLENFFDISINCTIGKTVCKSFKIVCCHSDVNAAQFPLEFIKSSLISLFNQELIDFSPVSVTMYAKGSFHFRNEYTPNYITSPKETTPCLI